MLLLPWSYKIFAIKYTQSAINYLHKSLPACCLYLHFMSTSIFAFYSKLYLHPLLITLKETLSEFFLLLFYTTHSTTFYGKLYISTSHSSFKQFPLEMFPTSPPVCCVRATPCSTVRTGGSIRCASSSTATPFNECEFINLEELYLCVRCGWRYKCICSCITDCSCECECISDCVLYLYP